MEEIYTQWRSSLKVKQKKRTYGHFDVSLDLNDEKDFKHVTRVLKNIKAHEFLPLVKFIKKDIRYRRGKDGVSIRSQKERPIMYSSHLDAHIYGFYAYQWAKRYEDFLKKQNIADVAIAYRTVIGKIGDQRGKNNISFAQEVFDRVQNAGDCAVIIADISKFFDTLSHKILKERLTLILGDNRLSDDEYKIFRSLTAFRYVLNDSSKKKTHGTYAKFKTQIKNCLRRKKCSVAQAVYESGREGVIKENRTPKGIPQGSPLSGLLANIYMSTFDLEFTRSFPDMLYRRYSDDIAIVCPVLEAKSIFTALVDAIKKYALDIQSSKVFIATFKKSDDGFMTCAEVTDGAGKILNKNFVDYLGFTFDGRTVRVRGKTLQNAYKKADKRTKKFLRRQFIKNPRKLHDTANHLKVRRNNAYIKSAKQIMDHVGEGIGSQQRKFFKFIQKKKTIYKKRIDARTK